MLSETHAFRETHFPWFWNFLKLFLLSSLTECDVLEALFPCHRDTLKFFKWVRATSRIIGDQTDPKLIKWFVLTQGAVGQVEESRSSLGLSHLKVCAWSPPADSLEVARQEWCLQACKLCRFAHRIPTFLSFFFLSFWFKCVYQLGLSWKVVYVFYFFILSLKLLETFKTIVIY